MLSVSSVAGHQTVNGICVKQDRHCDHMLPSTGGRKILGRSARSPLLSLMMFSVWPKDKQYVISDDHKPRSLSVRFMVLSVNLLVNRAILSINKHQTDLDRLIEKVIDCRFDWSVAFFIDWAKKQAVHEVGLSEAGGVREGAVLKKQGSGLHHRAAHSELLVFSSHFHVRSDLSSALTEIHTPCFRLTAAGPVPPRWPTCC